jgi:hypothetical protein
MTKETDNVRILKALRAGDVRVTDWTDKNTPDGGKPILRVAARINDLRKAGWPIERTGRHNNCAVYSLVNTTKPRKAA